MNPYITERLAATEQPANVALAHRMLNLSCFLLLLTVVVGKAWDGWWHITHTFDGFWAPPHVFVYSMAALTSVVVAVMAFVPQIRQSLGTRFPALGLPFDLPGALFLMASGFVALGIAGVMLDNLWHTAFGLDETAWSAPHVMIGQALAVISTGYIAARLALRPEHPLRWYTTFWLALLLISFSVTALGPLYDHATLDTVRALRQIPILAAQPQAQHGYTILEQWNLTRSNQLAVPLTALAIGCALTLVQLLEPRRWRFVAIIAAWTLLTYSGQHSDARWLNQYAPTLANPANWLPLPLLPAACVGVWPTQWLARFGNYAWCWLRVWLVDALDLGNEQCVGACACRCAVLSAWYNCWQMRLAHLGTARRTWRVDTALCPRCCIAAYNWRSRSLSAFTHALVAVLFGYTPGLLKQWLKRSVGCFALVGRQFAHSFGVGKRQ